MDDKEVKYPDISALMGDAKSILYTIPEMIADKIEEEFLFALRNNAYPPIVGEITLHEIRSRGIVMITRNNKIWLQQGKRTISNVIRTVIGEDCVIVETVIPTESAERR